MLKKIAFKTAKFHFLKHEVSFQNGKDIIVIIRMCKFVPFFVESQTLLSFIWSGVTYSVDRLYRRKKKYNMISFPFYFLETASRSDFVCH